MTRRSHQLQDELLVFVSLATAMVILLAAAGGMWGWSSILEHAAQVTVERESSLPQKEHREPSNR